MKTSRNGSERIQENTIEKGQRGSLGDTRSKSDPGRTTTKAMRGGTITIKIKGGKKRMQKIQKWITKTRTRIESTIKIDGGSIPDGGC